MCKASEQGRQVLAIGRKRRVAKESTDDDESDSEKVVTQDVFKQQLVGIVRPYAEALVSLNYAAVPIQVLLSDQVLTTWHKHAQQVGLSLSHNLSEYYYHHLSLLVMLPLKHTITIVNCVSSLHLNYHYLHVTTSLVRTCHYRTMCTLKLHYLCYYLTIIRFESRVVFRN